MKDLWIAGIARGHNGGVSLLKNGQLVFSIEEERLSRKKYDGGPIASIVKILEYTDKLDYLVLAHTHPSDQKIEFSSDEIYTGIARKFGLIERNYNIQEPHPQVIDMSNTHHKLHASVAFYNSGFKEAAALIVDGAGSFIPYKTFLGKDITIWEVESIFNCTYGDITNSYKHFGTGEPLIAEVGIQEDGSNYIVTDRAGIVKTYEAVTAYCGFGFIEAGKTMGLFPYGKLNSKIPKLFTDEAANITLSNRNIITPTYPNGSYINENIFDELKGALPTDTLTDLDNRRDMAYAVQTQTQEQVLNLILKAAEITGQKNIVLSGGYGLNCVANYYYLDKLKDEDINLYVEPVSNDAGTATGAALIHYYNISNDKKVRERMNSLYLGPLYNYSEEYINDVMEEADEILSNITYSDVIEKILDNNIVTIYQGRSENGPRALGNRSILYDPRAINGKDFVNSVKHREYFRPFAGTILKEFAAEWFDMRGLKETPHMMYAMNINKEYETQIPAIIHEDGTCRIQTVTKTQNKHYYNLIKEFYNKTKVPILFNTSFNLGGEPLVETIEDAVHTMKNSNLEYLYLPEFKKLVKFSNLKYNY